MEWTKCKVTKTAAENKGTKGKNCSCLPDLRIGLIGNIQCLIS